MADRASSRIVTTPGVCGGRPRIAGNRIRVQDVVTWHKLPGQSVDEIVRGHPTIGHADVHAALLYYHEHQRELNRAMRQEREYVARMYERWMKQQGTELSRPAHARDRGIHARSR